MSENTQGVNGEVRIFPLEGCDRRAFRALIRAEARLWMDHLHWDLSQTMTALDNALESRQLPGFLALAGEAPLGYIYWVRQRDLAIVGSVFAPATRAGDGVLPLLLRRGFEHLQRDRTVRRIEGQILHFGDALLDQALRECGASILGRCFMAAPLGQGRAQGPASCPPGYEIVPFKPSMVDPAADLIHESYVGALDALMSRCYQTALGCRNFLNSIVRRNGIGTYDPAASLVAIGPGPVLAGVVMATAVSPGAGHIPQISVAPGHQGRGLGRALILRCKESLGGRDFERLSLSVTRDNARAYGLYRASGFETVLEFPAFYWER